MKDIRNIIKWTSSDEILHFNIGAMIVDILRKESPEMFNSSLEERVIESCVKSFKHEKELIDWVFEKGELPNLKKSDLHDYIKYRINLSLNRLGFRKAFEGHSKHPEALMYYYEEVFADSQDDFFAVTPTDYNIKNKSFNQEEMW